MQCNHLEKTTVDALGRSEIEIYDPLNRVKEVRVKSPFGKVIAESSFSYDGRGNKIHQQENILSDDISMGCYHVYTTYDSMGQKTLEDEQGVKKTRFSYNCGRLESITNPDGVVISHIYDPLGRLEVQSSSDGTIYHRFTYDLNDNVIQAEDVVQQTTTYRSYDIKDRLIYEKQASGFEINYSYDPLDRVSDVIFENNRIAYFYTPTCPSSVSRYKDNQLQYTYSQQCDLMGRPLSRNLTNNSPIHYVWDKLGRCIEIGSNAYSQRLCYDKVGNLVTTKISDPLGEYETLFTYDDLNQLIGETGAFDNQYTNDSVNNRRSKNLLTCNLNELNQLLDDTIDNFSYDANGRRTQRNASQYTYDALGRLTRYSNNESYINYQYDPFGRLIQKNDNVYKYQFDTEIGTENEFRLVLGKASTLAMELNGVAYFPVRNHRGDICVVFDAQNQAVATYRYDAFGAFLENGSIQSPWLFSSQRYDAITSLYHYDKREYDPAQGRWLTPDPLGFADGPNLYAYVQNNPLTFVDPYGLWGESLCGWLSSCYDHVKSFGNSFGRGVVDDQSFGLSNYALGQHECKTWSSTAGYYAGTVASIGAGFCLTGTSWLKVAGYGGRGAAAATRYGASFFKGSLNYARTAKAGKTLTETHNIAKLTRESSTVIQSTAAKINKELGFKSTVDYSARQNNKLIAEKIAGGHAFEKHVLHKGEFKGYIRTRKQFASHIENIMNNPSEMKPFMNNTRTIYWDNRSSTVVVRNPYGKDGGTAFRPDDYKVYYDKQY